MQRSDTLDVDGSRVSVRPAREPDRVFLLSVYASTRAEELARTTWSVDEKRRFIEHQFGAQDHAYRNNYPGAEFLVLMIDGADAGRLYLHRRPAEIRIMDIALLPPFRRRGIGTAVLRRVLEEGAASGRTVSIHVEVFNPAQRLYERLGFRAVSRNDVYVLMEWRTA